MELKSLRKMAMAAEVFLACLVASCNTDLPVSDAFEAGAYEGGGAVGKDFKIPVAKGYDWEISQSWGEHCSLCDKKYPDSSNPYCESSHTDGCCKYGWDFNLPGNADRGKPVLATADGFVESVSFSASGWGNSVVINHGNNVCSRYAHMLAGSIGVSENETVCQGLQIGKIGTTGLSSGEHLHFQFEDCRTHESLKMGFTDGNGVPSCVRGNDRYDKNGGYIALSLTNTMKSSCENGNDGGSEFGDGKLPEGGWVTASCGALDGCPLIPNCGRAQNHVFKDQSKMTASVKGAAAYLYGECAVDGEQDGSFNSSGKLTRAAALKIPLYLFGLMRDCGSDEPFVDVDADDWFFTAVACGVTHGLLENVAHFDPQAEVNFAEAAKFAVTSAAFAGVIEMQNPANSHFPNITKDQWAYPYAETLYSYGGLSKSPSSYHSTDRISRGEYAEMIAALSPCFCGNVKCESGCKCDQSTFSCLDGKSGGTGGNSDDGNTDSEGDPESTPDETDSANWESELQIECTVSEEDMRCDGANTILYIKCSITNNGANSLQINDLVMVNDGGMGSCIITDSHLQSGVGVQVVDFGTKKALNGHYEISCTSVPSGNELEVSFDLKEKISGTITWYYQLLSTSIEASGNLFGKCGGGSDSGSASDSGSSSTPDNGSSCIPTSCFDAGRNCGNFNDGCQTVSCGTCAPPFFCDGGLCRPCENASCWQDWKCDPSNSYQVGVQSNGGGSVEVFRSGANAQDSFDLVNNSAYIIFKCEDLPAAILVHGGPTDVSVFSDIHVAHPPLAFYYPYAGSLTINPSILPKEIGMNMGVNGANIDVLVRIPFAY
jgi:hypothetical protein